MSAQKSIERLIEAGKWPGKNPEPVILSRSSQNEGDDVTHEEWDTWDYVPDGLLVWEAWNDWIMSNNGEV